MEYMLRRNNIWYFNRRPPKEVSQFDPRRFVKISLGTENKKLAKRLALRENFKLEQYWESLIERGLKHTHENYKQVVNRANALGFIYLTNQQLADTALTEILRRVETLETNSHPKQIEAVLGAIEAPAVNIDDSVNIYFDLTKDVRIDKSERQYKKWQNQRKLAISNASLVIGNKSIQQIDRQDMLLLRDWWIDRIEIDKVKPGTANKQLFQLRSIISDVADHLKIKIDIKHLFNKIPFKDKYVPRPPFSTEHICKVLLNPKKLAGMNDVYKGILHVFAETGVHIDEQIGLKPEDIFLNSPIPYIEIKSRDKDKLKTEYRERVIPLVGYALDVFKKYPTGFSQFTNHSDSVSSAIGKYLRENVMLPSENHSAYSLRHSFQDRLTNLDCPDRIQTDLMGHKFNRTKYGSGATLQHRYDWMKKIQLKPE